MEENQQRSVRDIFYVLFKHKGLIITVFLLSIIITALIILSKPDVYVSNAKILVSGRQTNAIEMVTGVTGPTEVNSEVELILSRGFAEAVVDKVGPEKILFVQEKKENDIIAILMNFLKSSGILKEKKEVIDPAKMREGAIKVYTDSLEINANQRSNIINLTYYAQTPELAQEILSA